MEVKLKSFYLEDIEYELDQTLSTLNKGFIVTSSDINLDNIGNLELGVNHRNLIG